MSQVVQVRVKPEYLPHQSDPDRNRYVFAYRVLISNEGDASVKLISRYWLITDGNGDTREVKGQGVVGEQPVIEPGGTYIYTSGAVAETEVSTMQGYYLMQPLTGGEAADLVEVTIPVFTLAVPNRLN